MSTTQENIHALLNGFDTHLLPQTLLDAVHVTRQLGVQYLWIDSLCIIQDSADDWEREASNMAEIYANAYCTIAATRAEDGHGGFLQPRSQRESVAIRPPNGVPYYVCDVIDDFRHDVESSTLNQRGWVLQERALSPRTIYFAESQVYWECGEGVHCETLTKMKKYVFQSVFSQ